MNLPKKVTIREVALRDGIQGRKEFIPTEVKIRIINAIAEAGVPRIEATSFMNPRAIPQTTDAEQVMAGVERRPGTSYECLVANLKGAQRAADAGVDAMCLVIAASDTMNRANVNMTAEESLAQVPAILKTARHANIPLMAGIASATGCPYTGQVAQDRVLWLADELVRLGVDELYFADSVGFGNPAEMERLVTLFQERHPEMPMGVHIHDTRGLGLANTVACLQAGTALLEGSIGGLGGCPYAPGSSGNVCTEDMVHMLHLMG
ncbi:MAG: hydroxymethylglutaryl-CoA lyase, partial [Dehalococcoidia bacterium]|nr:hydroxymethylglutaryl-CoA lyase [Dehalococcoidia bacterium]